MAFQLASAYVELSSRGLSGVQSGISSIKGGLTSLTGMAVTAGSALLGMAGVAGVGGMIKLAADAESAAAEIKVMVGSAESAQKILKDLNDFAANTPFDIAGLTDVTKKLLAFGVAQDQLLPTMQVLGDLAGNDSQKFNDLASVYGKVRAAGKLTAETLSQLTERAVNPTKELAKQLGVAETEIGKMVSEGKIGFGDLQNALKSMTSEGGQYFENMKTQSETTLGLFSTMKDGIVGVLRDIGTEIIEGFDLRGGMKSVIEMTKTVSDWLIPAVRSLVGDIKSFVTNNWEMITSLTKAAAVILGTAGAAALLTTGITALGAAFVFLTSPLGIVAVGLAGLAIAFPEFFNALFNDLAFLAANWDITWKLMWEHAKLMWGNLQERVNTVAVNMVEVFSWVGDNWYQIFETTANANLAIFQNLWTNFKGGWQALLDFFQGNAITFEWTPLLDGFKNTIGKFPELTKANIQDTNAEIEKLNAQLQGRMQPKTNADKAASEGAAAFKTDGGGGAGAAGAAGADKAKAGAGVEFIGFAQFAEKMQGQANNDAKEREKLELQKQQAQAAIDLNKQAGGPGVKVQVVNQWKPEGVNPAFGT